MRCVCVSDRDVGNSDASYQFTKVEKAVDRGQKNCVKLRKEAVSESRMRTKCKIKATGGNDGNKLINHESQVLQMK